MYKLNVVVWSVIDSMKVCVSLWNVQTFRKMYRYYTLYVLILAAIVSYQHLSFLKTCIYMQYFKTKIKYMYIYFCGSTLSCFYKLKQRVFDAYVYFVSYCTVFMTCIYNRSSIDIPGKGNATLFIWYVYNNTAPRLQQYINQTLCQRAVIYRWNQGLSHWYQQ